MLSFSGLPPALMAQGQRAIDQFSLEELLDMEITSVSRNGQEVVESAAAVFILTSDDIRKSGMNSLPELLRLVPGLNVMNIDANKWAISARGFNGRWSNKLQVLIDGRSVYTPVFSGVYWDIQDIPLQDLERIEVIKGPGAAVWGANAVNGVINIITRHSRDTQGTQVSVLAGNQDRVASVRHGQSLGENAWFRAYARRTDRNSFDSVFGQGKLFDAWELDHAGARLDWQPTDKDQLLFQVDHYQGRAGQETVYLQNVNSQPFYLEDLARTDGGSLQFTWLKEVSGTNNWEFNSYYYRNDRSEYGVFRAVHTFDAEIVNRLRLGSAHDFTWGLGYREVRDALGGNFTVSFDPRSRTLDQVTGFFQDQWQLGDKFNLTLGAKLEDNFYTGFEYQPSVRMSWQVDQQQILWAAVSRAVRTPSRADTDIRINLTTIANPFVDLDGPGPLLPGDPALVSILSNPQLQSENLLAFEAGFRGRITETLNLDIAAFYNDYDDLVGNAAGQPVLESGGMPLHLLLPQYFNNEELAESWGMEASLVWQAGERLRVHASHAWLDVQVEGKAQADPISMERKVALEDSAPTHQTQVRLQWDLSASTNININLFHQTGTTGRTPFGLREVGAFSRVDVAIHWVFGQGVRASLVGQNLFDPSHEEFHTVDLLSGAVPRSLYFRLEKAF